MEVASITAQHGTAYDNFAGHVERMMEEAQKLAAPPQNANEQAQAQELEKVFRQLLQMKREAKCRKAALDNVRAQQSQQAPAEQDLSRLYEEQVAEQLSAAAPPGTDERLREFLEQAQGEAAGNGGSDSDIEMEGGDTEKKYKCPMTGYSSWIEDPVRPYAPAPNPPRPPSLVPLFSPLTAPRLGLAGEHAAAIWRACSRGQT